MSIWVEIGFDQNWLIDRIINWLTEWVSEIGNWEEDYRNSNKEQLFPSVVAYYQADYDECGDEHEEMKDVDYPL